MSRRDSNGSHFTLEPPLTLDEQQAIEQSLDMQMITHVKELLCTLWKQSRITIGVRSAGEAALGAAQEAIERPNLRQVTFRDGQRLSNAQWHAEQRRHNDAF